MSYLYKVIHIILYEVIQNKNQSLAQVILK